MLISFRINTYTPFTERIRGCRFLLAQSWWRNIQNQSISEIYKDTSLETGNFFKMFFSLPILNSTKVIDCFTNELMAIQQTDNEKFLEFVDYVFDT